MDPAALFLFAITMGAASLFGFGELKLLEIVYLGAIALLFLFILSFKNTANRKGKGRKWKE